ncbi:MULTISPECIES: double-strand break repair helicase AddA [unclassified Beijerinckia]|uniref:double-strand break repair helicase AddA n=1 Tax=unclassified Beijerinckia TaxID=2638183 RepID=UPI00089DA6E6|nr:MULTISPECIES: double-strand break repair helicase AddA [unclassified Beijerinckia]MDH7797375.1 ATP-dependent helicase/nuclease subunit A [Beijerinckia sp. GAS462]SEC83093.1 DNA helicase/exodeoxyribonuclease V, subunit A [Beijerinckia sp. 28-YEA-48]
MSAGRSSSRSSLSQAAASDPSVSVWVSANAGSGKTHVLAHRVIRLLLNNVEPGKILCLTFTKAAAANMARRVFDILSGWTSFDDETLQQALSDMTGRTGHDLAFARTLFARTIETPGGLKVQTIHAFCERLLHMFPFEANIAAGFSVIETDAQEELLQRAREDVLALAIDAPDSVAGRALHLITGLTSEAKFDQLLKGGLAKHAAIEAVLGRLQEGGYRARLAQELGLRPSETIEALDAEITEGGPSKKDWATAAEILEASSASDQKQAGRIRAFLAVSSVEILRATVLTDKGEPRKTFATKAAQARLDPTIVDELERLPPLLEKHKAARCVERSAALLELLNAILLRYRHLKTAHGKLDFADLIERTMMLLDRSSAAWVLYKLDNGIDHVLVDEAQDTSPEQWHILQRLTEEFFAGSGGGAPRLRTLFVVGDEKQSIFSFQGARPELFAGMRRHFEDRAGPGELRPVPLTVSYRSASLVLEQVDRTFMASDAYRSVVSGDDGWLRHEAYKAQLPGLVEIWDVIEPVEVEAPTSWLLPVDAVREDAPEVRLAQRIANLIRDWIRPGSGEFVHDGSGAPRQVNAGDIIILVRRRNNFFDAMIRSLKAAGVPVAGADVLKLTDHIAVMDLMAVGRFALLPQDDLSLACVLTSPLGGLDDDDLLQFAPQRAGSLYEALQASPDPKHRQVAARLARWIALAAEMTPFGFYAHLLGADGGRRDLLLRLGGEANDAIDEFLNRALAHEKSQPPSLSAFLHTFAATEATVKRDLEAAGEVVRVMTVHAAKGLEGKIVFLPDTTGAPGSYFDPDIVFIAGEDDLALPVWRRNRDEDPPAVEAAKGQSRLEQQNEYLRLLYVAMTRAEERLYICGYRGLQKLNDDCWYQVARRALEAGMDSVPAPWNDGEQVLRAGSTATGGRLPEASLSRDRAEPDWLRQAAPQERAPLPPISPSRALAAADQLEPSVRDNSSAVALVVGTLMHGLLQYLPDLAPSLRAAAARRFLAARGRALVPDEQERLASQALALIDNPALAALFGPQSRAEVTIAGKVRRPSAAPLDIAGRIDRLAVLDADVLIADFKTGMPKALADLPPAYVTQMALYAAAIAPLYPGKTIRPFIVWTASAQAVEIPAERLVLALEATIIR